MGKNVTVFERNLSRLEKILPTVARDVCATSLSGVEEGKTRKGEANLLLDGAPLHASYSAEKEAEHWFASANTDGGEVLFVYGIGLGYAFDACCSWLQGDPGRYLVFLEDDLRVLKALLATERGGELLEHRQVQLHYFESIEKAEPMVSWLTWYFIRCQIEVSALPAYEKKKERAICPFAPLARS